MVSHCGMSEIAPVGSGGVDRGRYKTIVVKLEHNQ